MAVYNSDETSCLLRENRATWIPFSFWGPKYGSTFKMRAESFCGGDECQLRHENTLMGDNSIR
jgi:hypothetical protein